MNSKNLKKVLKELNRTFPKKKAKEALHEIMACCEGSDEALQWDKIQRANNFRLYLILEGIISAM